MPTDPRLVEAYKRIEAERGVGDLQRTDRPGDLARSAAMGAVAAPVIPTALGLWGHSYQMFDTLKRKRIARTLTNKENFDKLFPHLPQYTSLPEFKKRFGSAVQHLTQSDEAWQKAWKGYLAESSEGLRTGAEQALLGDRVDQNVLETLAAAAVKAEEESKARLPTAKLPWSDSGPAVKRFAKNVGMGALPFVAIGGIAGAATYQRRKKKWRDLQAEAQKEASVVRRSLVSELRKIAEASGAEQSQPNQGQRGGESPQVGQMAGGSQNEPGQVGSQANPTLREETIANEAMPAHGVVASRVKQLESSRALGIPILKPPPGYVYDPNRTAFVPDEMDSGWGPESQDPEMESQDPEGEEQPEPVKRSRPQRPSPAAGRKKGVVLKFG